MRRTTLTALTAAAVLAFAACGSEPAPPEELCPSPTEATSVDMADFSYSPTCVAADAGSSLEVRNAGPTTHTFTVNETDIDVSVDSGDSASVDLGGVAAGTYEVICTLHPQMTGALQVR